jgi:hypothetical protein
MRDSLFTTFTSLFLAFSVQPQAHADLAPAPSNAIVQLSEGMASMCPQLVQGFINPDLAAAFIDRPIDTPSVCSCSTRALLADATLVSQFSVDLSVLTDRLESSNLKSYTIARIVSSAMTCLSQDISKSLAEVKLPQ